MEYISYLYIYIQCESLQQLALYTQPAQLLSLDPSLQLLASGQTNPQGHSPVPVDGADHYTQMHTQVSMTPWSHSRPPCALTLRDTQVLSHPELALRHPHTILDPKPLHLPAGSFSLIFTSDHTLARTPTLTPVTGTTDPIHARVHRVKSPLLENN